MFRVLLNTIFTFYMKPRTGGLQSRQDFCPSRQNTALTRASYNPVSGLEDVLLFVYLSTSCQHSHLCTRVRRPIAFHLCLIVVPHFCLFKLRPPSCLRQIVWCFR